MSRGLKVRISELIVKLSPSWCHLLITFANSLRSDQDRQNVRPVLDPNCMTLMVHCIPERVFQKIWFSKKLNR